MQFCDGDTAPGPGQFQQPTGPIPCLVAGLHSRCSQESSASPSRGPQGKESPDSCLRMHSSVLPLEPGSPPECLHIILIARFKAYLLLLLPQGKQTELFLMRGDVWLLWKQRYLTGDSEGDCKDQEEKWRRGGSREEV